MGLQLPKDTTNEFASFVFTLSFMLNTKQVTVNINLGLTQFCARDHLKKNLMKIEEIKYIKHSIMVIDQDVST